MCAVASARARCSQRTLCVTASVDEAAAHDAAVLAYNNPYLQESDWWTEKKSNKWGLSCGVT